MKKVILALVMMSSFAHAEIKFKSNTALPKELQEKVAVALSQKCPGVYNLSEDITGVVEKRVDQLAYDLHFTTHLSGLIALNGAPPVVSNITVNSVDASASISNPNFENRWIESVVSADCQ